MADCMPLALVEHLPVGYVQALREGDHSDPELIRIGHEAVRVYHEHARLVAEARARMEEGRIRK